MPTLSRSAHAVIDGVVTLRCMTGSEERHVHFSLLLTTDFAQHRTWCNLGRDRKVVQECNCLSSMAQHSAAHGSP
jgi:hypothetical protein